MGTLIKTDKDRLNLPLTRKRQGRWRTPTEVMMRRRGGEKGRGSDVLQEKPEISGKIPQQLI